MSNVIIPGYRKTNPIVYRSKSKRIVQHYQHAYDEHGNVIVVEAGKDDLEEMVNQYKDEVGLKNVLKMVLKTQNPDLLNNMAYNDEVDAVDATGIPTSINELGEFIDSTSEASIKNLADLNEKLGTNFTAQSLLQAVVDGSLQTLIDAKLKASEEPKEEGEVK